MGVAEALALVAQIVPVATNIINTINNAGVNTGGSQDVVDLVANLAPQASALISRVEEIRNQTEAQYPQVWADVRGDWMSAVSAWQAKQGQ